MNGVHSCFMRRSAEEYSGYDGTRMYMVSWHPDDHPRAVVIAIHGLGSHADTLEKIGEAFAKRGFVLFAPDMRGFGHFSGEKGHVNSFDEYVQDMERLISDLNLRYPGLKVFLVGHSLGGLHAVRYCMRHPDRVAGLVAVCPGVSEKLKVSRPTRMIVGLLSRLNLRKKFYDGIELDLVSRNSEYVQRLKNDPLRWDYVTARFAAEGFGARERAFESAHLLKTPLLLQQSGDDMLVDPVQNEDFFRRVASQDKTFRSYPGLYHEPFEEAGGQQMIDDMVAWVEART
ncbi:MAG: alpha/beta hydrolase [Candidatus Thorarchaeota archaeon]